MVQQVSLFLTLLHIRHIQTTPEIFFALLFIGEKNSDSPKK